MTISSKTAIGRRELRKGEKDKYQGKKRKEDYKRGRTRGGNLYQGLNHLALCLLKHPPSTCRVLLFLRAPQDASAPSTPPSSLREGTALTSIFILPALCLHGSLLPIFSPRVSHLGTCPILSLHPPLWMMPWSPSCKNFLHDLAEFSGNIPPPSFCDHVSNQCCTLGEGPDCSPHTLAPIHYSPRNLQSV